MNVKRLFTEHPDAVGESYLEHMRVALSFAGPLLFAGAAALVHAVLPFLCVTTASATVKRLHARMMNRAKPAIRYVDPLPANGLPLWDPVI